MNYHHRRQRDPDEWWTGPAAPNTRPHEQRQRFDSLFSDPHHYRGDYRMVCASFRQHRTDELSAEERDALAQRFFSTDPTDGPGAVSELRRISLVIVGARTVLELTRENQRCRYRDASPAGPVERRGRDRGSWDARDLPRIDARRWRPDVLGRPRGRFTPLDVPVRLIDEDGAVAATETARLLVRDRVIGGPLVLFQCPRCRRLCRYLYAGPNGLTCRKGLGLVYRTRSQEALPARGVRDAQTRTPAPAERNHQ